MMIQECASATGFQEILVESATQRDHWYTVTIPPWDRIEEEVVCECPSYHNRGYCRHQREALASICNWSDLEDSVAQTPEQRRQHTCPECGGPTRTVVING